MPIITTFSTTATTRPLAAIGCAATYNPYTDTNNQVFSFCAVFESSVPSNQPAITTFLAVTTFITYYGVFAVTGSSAPYSIVAAQGEILYKAGTAIQSVTPFTLGGSLLSGYDNTLNVGSTTSPISSNGISLLLSNNVQVILQYNQTTNLLQELFSNSTNLRRSALTNITVNRYTLSNVILNTIPATCPIISTQSISPPSVTPTCPSGQTAVQYGDSRVADENPTYNAEGVNTAPGNTIHTRPFTILTNNTIINQLGFIVNQNPNSVIHMRMGIFTNTTGITPLYTLLSQTAEITLTNVGDSVIIAPLLSPLSLQAGITYSMGIWFDQNTYAGFNVWFYAPAVSIPYTSTSLANNFIATTSNAVRQLAAFGCVAQASKQFNFCASFLYATTTVTYSAVLTTTNNLQTNSLGTYYTVTGVTGIATVTTLSTGLRTNYNISLAQYGLTTYDNNLYLSNNNNNNVFDNYGLSLVIGSSLYIQTVISASTNAYYETQSTSLGVLSILSNKINNVTISTYTQSSSTTAVTLPYCASFTGVNVVTPTSNKQQCSSGSISTTLGDPNINNYITHTEGTNALANTVYIQTVTPAVSGIINQIAIGILNNNNGINNNIIHLQLGLYQNNNLLTQTNEITLNQTFDQIIYGTLNLPITVTSGQAYQLAFWTDVPLATAAGSTMVSVMSSTYSSTSLPSTFTQTSTDSIRPLAAFVCGTATYSFCGIFQTFVSGTALVAAQTQTVYVEGVVSTSATSQQNTYGTGYAIGAGVGHVTTVISLGGPSGATTTYYSAVLNVTGSTAYVYTSATNGLVIDPSGWKLTLTASSGATFTALLTASSASANAISQYAGPAMNSTQLSSLTITPYSTANNVPSCGAASLQHQTTPTPPAAPTCASGQSSITYGDVNENDLQSDVEGVNGMLSNYVFMRSFTTGSQAVIAYQLAFGVNANPNTIVNIRMALYDGNNNFLQSTNNIFIINPFDQQTIIGTLLTPVTLLPNTVYQMGLWTDMSLWAGFTAGGEPAESVAYYSAPAVQNSWPSIFVASQTNSLRAQSIIGCTTTYTPASSSTGANVNGASSASNAHVTSSVSTASNTTISTGCSAYAPGPTSGGVLVSVTLAGSISSLNPSSLVRNLFTALAADTQLSVAQFSCASVIDTTGVIGNTADVSTQTIITFFVLSAHGVNAQSVATQLQNDATGGRLQTFISESSLSAASVVCLANCPTTPTCTAATTTTSSSGLSTGAIVGIVIGCSFGLLILCCILAYCFFFVGATSLGKKKTMTSDSETKQNISSYAPHKDESRIGTNDATDVEMSQSQQPATHETETI